MSTVEDLCAVLVVATDDYDDGGGDDGGDDDAGITIDGENVRLLVINCIRPLLGNNVLIVCYYYHYNS